MKILSEISTTVCIVTVRCKACNVEVHISDTPLRGTIIETAISYAKEIHTHTCADGSIGISELIAATPQVIPIFVEE